MHMLKKIIIFKDSEKNLKTNFFQSSKSVWVTKKVQDS